MSGSSIEISQEITRRSSSNLAFAFFMLPRERREAMAALYAFCREVDDIADEESRSVSERRRLLSEWRVDITEACGQGRPFIPVIRELQPYILRFKLPLKHFEEIISGVEMDLDIDRYESLADLESYCFKVASAVGLLSIEIFGYRHDSAKTYAVALGKALQLTNILRDVRNDAQRGRIYLPLEDLRRFHVPEQELLEGGFSERYKKTASLLARRAEDYYREASRALAVEDRRSMVASECMGAIYWQLLKKLEAIDFNVFTVDRVRISKTRKLVLALRTYFRNRWMPSIPCYGS